MKRLITAIAVMAMAVSAYAGDSLSWTDGKGVTWYFECGPSEDATPVTVATIVGAEGYGTTLTIPETVYDGGVAYPVAAIGKSAFDGYYDPNVEKIKKVVMPDGVVRIDDYAFSVCEVPSTTPRRSTAGGRRRRAA